MNDEERAVQRIAEARLRIELLLDELADACGELYSAMNEGERVNDVPALMAKGER